MDELRTNAAPTAAVGLNRIHAAAEQRLIALRSLLQGRRNVLSNHKTREHNQQSGFKHAAQQAPSAHPRGLQYNQLVVRRHNP